MGRIETVDLARQCEALRLGGVQRLLRGVELAGDVAPGIEPALALKDVVDEIPGQCHPKYRGNEKARPPTHLVQHHHRDRESCGWGRVNAALRRGGSSF